MLGWRGRPNQAGPMEPLSQRILECPSIPSECSRRLAATTVLSARGLTMTQAPASGTPTLRRKRLIEVAFPLERGVGAFAAGEECAVWAHHHAAYRQAAVELSTEGLSWLSERLQASFDALGKVPQAHARQTGLTRRARWFFIG